MKRVIFGILWFVVFVFGGFFLGGGISGGIAGSKVQATSISEGYPKGKEAGAVAGAEFGRKYGNAIFLGALVLSVVGTATGFLPGTKSRKKDDDA
jgi:hypothetical protein